jgi:hypothetical protein
MNLLQVTRDLMLFDREWTIYAAKPWTQTSAATVCPEPASGHLPDEAEKLGLVYFLEVFIAREVIEGRTTNLCTQTSEAEKCARLIKYAVSDA